METICGWAEGKWTCDSGLTKPQATWQETLEWVKLISVLHRPQVAGQLPLVTITRCVLPWAWCDLEWGSSLQQRQSLQELTAGGC